MIKKQILDLGCGNRKREGSIGIDINPKTNADVIHNLNDFPYPFEDSKFDEIYADNVIEHLNDVIKVMEELYRIGKPGGLIKVDVPYFRAHWAYIDPTHKHFFTTQSFSYFDPQHINNKLFPYSSVTFKIEKIIFNEKISSRIIKSIVKSFANKYPILYETYIISILPMDELSFYLRIIKWSE